MKGEQKISIVTICATAKEQDIFNYLKDNHKYYEYPFVILKKLYNEYLSDYSLVHYIEISYDREYIGIAVANKLDIVFHLDKPLDDKQLKETEKKFIEITELEINKIDKPLNIEIE